MRDRGGNILRFLTLPLFAAVATALLFLVTYLDQHAEVGILAIVFVVSFLIHIGVALCFVVNFCINIGKRKFVSAASTLLAFSIMIVSLVQAQALTEKTFHGIDIVRFFFSQNYYLRIVESQRDQTQRFPWGSGGFLGTNFFYTLIYRPHGSNDHPILTKRSDCTGTVSEIRKDFYIESQVCQ